MSMKQSSDSQDELYIEASALLQTLRDESRILEGMTQLLQRKKPWYIRLMEWAKGV